MRKSTTGKSFMPDVINFDEDFPEIDYDLATFNYIGNNPIDCGPYEFSTPYYIGDNGVKYPTHYTISEVNEDGSLKTDIEMHTKLIEVIWTLIVDKYHLETNWGGFLDKPVDAVDEWIDELYDEVDYYTGKKPMSKVLFAIDRDRYTTFAYDFVVGLVDTAMEDLAINGVAEVADFRVTLKKY